MGEKLDSYLQSPHLQSEYCETGTMHSVKSIESTLKDFKAKYWLHCFLVHVNSKKYVQPV